MLPGEEGAGGVAWHAEVHMGACCYGRSAYVGGVISIMGARRGGTHFLGKKKTGGTLFDALLAWLNCVRFSFIGFCAFELAWEMMFSFFRLSDVNLGGPNPNLFFIAKKNNLKKTKKQRACCGSGGVGFIYLFIFSLGSKQNRIILL